jgi:hypothetical protein
VDAKYICDAERDGVTLKINGQKVTFWFNRNGKVGGEVVYDGKAAPLTDKIQKQSGFEY